MMDISKISSKDDVPANQNELIEDFEVASKVARQYSDVSNSSSIGNIVMQSFGGVQFSSPYDSESGSPQLSSPLSPEEVDKQPCELAVRLTIDDYFGAQLAQILKDSGTGIAADTLIEKVKAKNNLTVSEQQYVDKAKEKTIRECHLPETWVYESKERSDWVIQGSIPAVIDSQKVEAMRFKIVLGGVSNIVSSIQTAVQSQDSKETKPAEDIYKLIYMATSKLNALLQRIELPTLETSQKITEAKINKIKLNIKANIETFKELVKQAEANSKSSLNWLGAVISALTVVACAAVVIVTGGASAAVIALAVSSVMLGYSTVDRFTGVSQKLAEAMASLSPEVQAVILAGFITVIVAVSFTSLGVGAVGVVQMGKGFGEQVVLQSAIMILTSSKIVSNLIIKALIASGAVDENDKETIATLEIICTMIVTLTLMITTLGVMRAKENALEAAKRAASLGAATAEGAAVAVKSVTESASLVDAMNKALDSAKEFVFEMINGIRDMIRNLSADQMKALFASFVSAGIEGASELGKNVVDFIPDALKGLQKLALNWENPLQRGMAFLTKIQVFLHLSESTVTVMKGIIMAGIYKTLADMEEATGNLEYASECNERIVKLFEKMLEMLQDSNDCLTDWSYELGESLQAISSSWKKAFQPDMRG